MGNADIYNPTMIFEHSINQRETLTRPPIKFHYITPNPLPRHHSLAHLPALPVANLPTRTSTHPVPRIFQRKQSPERWAKPQRKKIFDRTYSTKSSLFGRSDGGMLRKKARSTGKLHASVKKQRKAIFSKNRRGGQAPVQQEPVFLRLAPLQYGSNPSSSTKLKPPSSLTSYINVDALRREPRQHYQTNVFNRHHEDAFLTDRQEQESFNHPNISSEVKVTLSDDESYASPSIDCTPLPIQTQERFFDKDATYHAPKRQEKLAEVNLYQTAVHGKLIRKTAPAAPTLLQRLNKLMDRQIKQSLLPYSLIVMGLFLLLVQIYK